MAEFPSLPAGFRPEVLRALTLQEFLVVAGRYGLVQIGQRMGYSEAYISFLEKIIHHKD